MEGEILLRRDEPHVRTVLAETGRGANSSPSQGESQAGFNGPTQVQQKTEHAFAKTGVAEGQRAEHGRNSTGKRLLHGLVFITILVIQAAWALRWLASNTGEWHRVLASWHEVWAWCRDHWSITDWPWRRWLSTATNSEPLVCGEHARHWYDACCGITPWQPIAWDPSIYGGYLLTPWHNAQGRWATFCLAWETSWRGYKLGLLMTLLCLPICWWWAMRGLGGSPSLAHGTMLVGVLAFWHGPGVAALTDGELDLVVASGLIPWIICNWWVWHRSSRLRAACGATAGLILLGWSFPLAGLVLLLTGVLWYLSLGERQSGWWHIITLACTIVVLACWYPTIRAACETWWLLDGRFPEREASWWANAAAWRAQDWAGGALLLAVAIFGCWRRGQHGSGRTWIIYLSLFTALGLAPLLPLPWAWQPARLMRCSWPLWLIASLLVLVRREANGHATTTAGHISAGVFRRGTSVVLGLGLTLGLGYLVLVSDMLNRLFLGPERLRSANVWEQPSSDNDNIQNHIRLLRSWLEAHTNLHAAVAFEEDERFFVWSPLVLAGSGRMFANGLSRETSWAFQEFYFRVQSSTSRSTVSASPHRGSEEKVSCVNGRPVSAWSAQELSGLLDRHNIGWILVRRPEAVQSLLQLRDAKLVAQDEHTGWRLIARSAPGYFLHGQGRLLRVQQGSLTLADLASQSGTCQLRLTYVPGLATSCDRCRLRPAQVAGVPFPCWEIVCPGPQGRLTIRHQRTFPIRD
ncbi:MAG: hypothetical protein NZM42_04850 [Gemmatales bacterium]|nr:hypothetical protein [Gemmatales bacterium]